MNRFKLNILASLIALQLSLKLTHLSLSSASHYFAIICLFDFIFCLPEKRAKFLILQRMAFSFMFVHIV